MGTVAKTKNHPYKSNSPVKASKFPNEYYGKKYVGICRKIRNLVIMGHIRLEETALISRYRSNTPLTSVIDASGLKVYDYLQAYLSLLQPYEFENFTRITQNYHHTWLIDIGYRVQLAVTISTEVDANEFMSVSFTENSTICGNSLGQSQNSKNLSDKPCAVIVDLITGLYTTTDMSTGNAIEYQEYVYSIQHNFIRIVNKFSTSIFNKDLILESYSLIHGNYEQRLQEIYTNIIGTYYDQECTSKFGARLEGASILTIGYTPTNTLMLLIDCYSTVVDTSSKQVLVEAASDVIYKIPINQLRSVKNALEANYNKIINFSNKLYTIIIAALDIEV